MSPDPGRGKPAFFKIDEVPTQDVSSPAFLAGCLGKLLSENPQTGQQTYFLELPPSWSAPSTICQSTLELLIVEGSIAVGNSRLGAGTFAAFPKGRYFPSISTSAGATAVAIWSPHFPEGEYYGDNPHILRIAEASWNFTEFPAETSTPGRRHAVKYKSLRWPDFIEGDTHGGRMGLLRLVSLVAGFVGDPRPESHPDCWEEIIWLAGDFFMPSTGRQAIGSYLGNPPGHIHGPLMTQRGCLLLVHTDGPASFCFHDPPVDAELVNSYMDGVSWLKEPVHIAHSSSSKAAPEGRS